MKTPNDNPWLYRIEEFNADDVALNGNRFMLGNGCMGMRGTLEESGKADLCKVRK
jgi:trehalose/maltose hydrolase-like predicted phosphorylase